jgi:hypothetical protein
MRTTLLCFILFFAAVSMGQAGSDLRPSGSPEPMFTFDQSDFQGRFAVMAASEDDFDYYVTDLTRMKERFERVYFLNQTYSDHRIVNIDPNIDGEQLWFKAHYQYEQSVMTCLLEDFMKDTKQVSQTWTDMEKNTWLQQHDKFKSLKSNEK